MDDISLNFAPSRSINEECFPVYPKTKKHCKKLALQELFICRPSLGKIKINSQDLPGNNVSETLMFLVSPGAQVSKVKT